MNTTGSMNFDYNIMNSVILIGQMEIHTKNFVIEINNEEEEFLMIQKEIHSNTDNKHLSIQVCIIEKDNRAPVPIIS